MINFLRRNNNFSIFIFFLIDILSISIFNGFFINSLIPLYTSMSMQRKNYFKICVMLLFLSFQNFLQFGRFGLVLGPLIIFNFLISRTHRFFSNVFFAAISFVTFYIIMQSIFIEKLILNNIFSFKSLFLSLVINGLISLFIVLIYNHNQDAKI